jgi:hypothetical protein
MKRACFTKDELMVLAAIVAQAFGLPQRNLFWKHGAPTTLEAKRFFCLYLYAVEGMPYKQISKFLRLNHDGARMLLRHLAKREPFPYTTIMQQVTADFRAYLKTTKTVETATDEQQKTTVG